MPGSPNQSSLHGKTVVVTRPLQQTNNIREQLISLDAQPILFPCIEIVAFDCAKQLSALPLPPEDFDMFIFISSNAVRHGFSCIPQLPEQITKGKTFAAIGQATAQALQEKGIQQIVAPDQGFDSESLLSLPAMKAIENRSVLIIKGVGGRSKLLDKLETRKANVQTIDVYQRQLPRDMDAMALPRAPDAILFSSSESVENMLKIIPAHDHHCILNSQTITGHARIAAKVTSLGFKKLPIIAANPSDSELLNALIGWANRTENHNEH